MQAVIFDIDHTLFTADARLRAGAADLLAMLERLGFALGAVSSNDHRALVRLDEAGIRQHFTSVLCSDHATPPKTLAGLTRVLDELHAAAHDTALVSHTYSDIVLGQNAGLAKTIAVTHRASADQLQHAGARHVVDDLPAVLDAVHL